jgi:predicted phage tail protein
VNEDGFQIERSPDGVTFSPLTSIAANVTTYSDPGLNAGTTYHYRVRAYNGAGPSVYSNSASATTVGPLVPPSNLSAASYSTSRIDLTWTDNSSDEDSFQIERSADGINFTQIGTAVANATSYSDTGLPPSTIDYYRIRAASAMIGNSAYSNVGSGATSGRSLEQGPLLVRYKPSGPSEYYIDPYRDVRV